MLKRLKKILKSLLSFRDKIRMSRSPFFSKSWYEANYSEALSKYNCSSISHYFNIGWHLGFDPAPSFSTNGYLELNPDVKESGICPLAHYLSYGIKENRRVLASQVPSITLTNSSLSIYDGVIDGVFSGYIQGWAYSSKTPSLPVEFKLLLDDKPLLHATANLYRADLESGGFGSGHHGFCCLNEVSLASYEGKTLQLVSLTNDKIGQPFVIPAASVEDISVKGVRVEEYLLVFDIVAKRNTTITFVLFNDGIYFIQLTSVLRLGDNEVQFPIDAKLADGQKHTITIGTQGSPLPLLHQKLTIPVQISDYVQYSRHKNINNKPTFIMIDRSTPKPDQDAGSFATVNEISLIKSLGFHVVFIPDDCFYSPIYTKKLEALGIEVLFSPFFSSSKEALIAKLPEACAVYIIRFNTVEKHIETIKTITPEIPVIFNNSDLHFLREIRQANYLDDNVLLERALETREREVKVMKQVDAILSYSEFEHAVISSHTLQSKNIYKCPWVVETPKKITSFEERHDVAFLGGYEHTPNVEAVTFFIEEVMPLIREEGCPIKVYIYGSKMPHSFYEYACEDVIIVGYVQSVETVYLKHRVFIAPLFFGAGVKGKVLSAAAHGIPCVLSPIAIEATGLMHNISALVANSPEEWAKYVVQLHSNEHEWRFVQGNQERVINDNYSFDKSKRMMRNIFKSIKLLE